LLEREEQGLEEVFRRQTDQLNRLVQEDQIELRLDDQLQANGPATNQCNLLQPELILNNHPTALVDQETDLVHFLPPSKLDEKMGR
jgi:hypothetical protein